MDILKLIDSIRARTPLWNRQSPLYTARAMKNQLWKEVVTLTGATKDEVRRKWKCLNDIFRREHNKYALRKKQDPEAEPPQWNYYHHLLFLESQIGTRFCMQTRKVSAAAAFTDGEREESDDRSGGGSSLGFETFADVVMKTEALDANSFDCGDDEDLRVMQSNVFECHLKEENIGDSFDSLDGYQPPAKRASRSSHLDNPAARCSAETETRTHECRVENVADKTLSRFSHRVADNVSNMSSANVCHILPKSNVEANVSAAVAGDGAARRRNDAVISQRLNGLEEWKLDDYKSLLRLAQLQQQQHVGDDDDDYHFALSLVPTMRALPVHRKMLLRMKIQQMLCEEIERINSAAGDGKNEAAVKKSEELL